MLSALVSKKGTGIVEIIAATVIFVVAAGAGTEIISYSKVVAARSEKILQATLYTSALMEQLASLQYRDIYPGNPDMPEAGVDNEMFTRSYSITEYDIDGNVIDPIDGTGTYKRIQVTTIWEGVVNPPNFIFYKTNPNA
jgi:hypothetical protein